MPARLPEPHEVELRKRDEAGVRSLRQIVGRRAAGGSLAAVVAARGAQLLLDRLGCDKPDR